MRVSDCASASATAWIGRGQHADDISISDGIRREARAAYKKARRAACLPLVVLSLIVALHAGEHPVPLEKGTDAAKCLECHEDKTKNKAVHSAMALGCMACHEVTTEKDTTTIKLTAPTAAAVCLQCHADRNATALKGRVHRPAVDNCTACHSPHSSPNKYQLLKPPSGAQSENLCLTCHDKGLKTPEHGSRHAALETGCDTCHQTHKVGDPGKTEFAFHLTKAVPALCLDCHDAKEKTLIAAHRDQPFAQADCSSCHDAHQSPSPKLMNANLHPPFAEKACDICHQPAKDGKVVVNENGKRALCYTCHDDKQKQVEQSKTQHPVFTATDTCTVCHNPHASREAKLLRSSQDQICTECHSKSKEAVRHGPYEKGQCAACHEPHGAGLPKLLRADGNNLCRACHVANEAGVKPGAEGVLLPWSTSVSAAAYEAAPKIGLDRDGQHGHPLVNHPTSGPNSRSKGDKAPITCGSCHEAHASKLPNLLPLSVDDYVALCGRCHK